MINFECKMLISGKNLIIVRIRIFINGLNIFFYFSNFVLLGFN